MNLKLIADSTVLAPNEAELAIHAKRAFAKLEPLQRAAISHLAIKDLIDPKRVRVGKVERTETPISNELASALIQFSLFSFPVIFYRDKVFF